jgi:hypothetical protein
MTRPTLTGPATSGKAVAVVRLNLDDVPLELVEASVMYALEAFGFAVERVNIEWVEDEPS